MRYGIITISLILSSFRFFYCNAQSTNKYIFRHINQLDGLLHNKILSITQDGEGFIWILSNNGLQRYDGSRFVNYPFGLNSPAGLGFKTGCGLFPDTINNRLWIIKENLENLDLKKNILMVYNDDKLLKNPYFGFEQYKDSTGNTWLAGNFGIFHSGAGIRKMQRYYLSASSSNNNTSNFIFKDEANHQIWMTDWAYGLLLFDKKTHKIYSHNFNPLHNPLLQLMDKKGLFYVFIDNDKNTWISTSGPDFYRFNPSTKKITTYSLSDIKPQQKNKKTNATLLVNCFFEDNHHTLWVGTQNSGLLTYNKEQDKFIPVTGEKETEQTIQYNYDINCIYQDKDDNIWLGTDKGITIFNPYHQYFQSVYHEENNPLSLPKNEIQESIETKNGEILTGTWGGGITVFDAAFNYKRNIYFTSDPGEYNLLWSFIQNDDGTIWAGCQHGIIHIYDPVKKTIRTIYVPETKSITIRCMAKDKSGNIYLGLHNGKIVKWDKHLNKFYAYNDSIPGIQQQFTPVLTMHTDNENNCWVGTEYGMKKFDPEKMIYSAVYIADKTNPSAISSNIVQCMDDMNDSVLVVGTQYGGLNFFNKKTKRFNHLTASNGLPANTINNVKRDGLNNIWFTTDYNLYQYITSENKFINYNIEPGIINSSFKPGNFYCLQNSKWLASTATEIISFNPDSSQKQERVNLPVDITGFKIFDKDFYIDSFLYAGKPIRLSYRQNFITIEYAALNFSELQDTKYYYKMSGVDKDWVYADTKRFAGYTNLDPGKYTFYVKTGNNNSKEKITSFNIIIAPPFWATTWFRLITILTAIAAIYFLFRIRIKSIRHEAELKQKIAETEMMALRAQMNPHFIFNCINSIDALIQSNDKYNATVYLNKFAKLIRNILDSSKQNIVTLAKDLDTLKLYIELEQLRHENKFIATINADEELMQDDYKVPPLIIQPFVENAILHGIRYRKGNDGKLSVSVSKQDSYLQYIIEDNGVGRDAFNNQVQKDKFSYGMDMSNDRIKLFNNEEKPSVQITDLFYDGKPAGTKVEVSLKIQ